MDPIDLRELFRRAQEGDGNALGHFIGHYLHRLFRYIRTRVKGNDALADDLTQATFIRMIERIDHHDFRSEDEFFGLLVRIAIGCISHHFRTQSNCRQSDETPAELEGVPAGDPPIPNGVALRELLDLVNRALSEMSADQQELIAAGVAAASEGKALKDVAAERDEPEGTVRWRLSRCRDELVERIRMLSPGAADWVRATFRGPAGRGEDTPRTAAPEHTRPRPKRRPKTGVRAADMPDPRPTAGLDGGATP